MGNARREAINHIAYLLFTVVFFLCCCREGGSPRSKKPPTDNLARDDEPVVRLKFTIFRGHHVRCIHRAEIQQRPTEVQRRRETHIPEIR